MQITNDIPRNKVLGREYKRGLEDGRLQGEREGKLEGELTMLRRLIEGRYGAILDWAEARLAISSSSHIEAFGERLPVQGLVWKKY
ncbi:MAG TPA: hypothetical protein VI756_29760 [Blastocatellia bacterium]